MVAGRMPHSVSRLTGVHPIVVYINRLREEIDIRLVLFHAHPANNLGGIFPFIHFHLARLFVVAERTIKLLIERLDVLALWWRLSFGFSTTHSPLDRLC